MIGCCVAWKCLVEDPQIDTVILPSGTKRFRPAAQIIDSRVSTLNLNYWFTESPLRSRTGRDSLIEYLARHLPEALPRRYGLFEPPSEEWEVGGKHAFLNFMDAHAAEGVVIYASRPVAAFDFQPVEVAWTRRGGKPIFQCGCLSLSFEFAALQDTGWLKAVERAWLDIARIAEPIATNVDLVDGWILRGRGHLWADGSTGHCSCTTAWFGIPRKLGLAFGLAETYFDYWPQLKSLGASAAGLRYVTTHFSFRQLCNRATLVVGGRVAEADGRLVKLAGRAPTPPPVSGATALPFTPNRFRRCSTTSSARRVRARR